MHYRIVRCIMLLSKGVRSLDNISMRIIKVVNKLGGNMSRFAREINVTPSYISKLSRQPEKCRPSDLVINSICSKFNVNEDWLRTGAGGDEAMFLPNVGNAIDEIAQEVELTERDRILIEKFLALPNESRQAVMDYVLSVAKAVQCKNDVETYGNKAKELAEKERISEKKPAVPVSSANGSAVG